MFFKIIVSFDHTTFNSLKQLKKHLKLAVLSFNFLIHTAFHLYASLKKHIGLCATPHKTV